MRRIAVALVLLGLVVASAVGQTISGSMAFKAGVNVTLDSAAQAQFAFRSAAAVDLGVREPTNGLSSLLSLHFSLQCPLMIVMNFNIQYN